MTLHCVSKKTQATSWILRSRQKTQAAGSSRRGANNELKHQIQGRQQCGNGRRSI